MSLSQSPLCGAFAIPDRKRLIECDAVQLGDFLDAPDLFVVVA